MISIAQMKLRSGLMISDSAAACGPYMPSQEAFPYAEQLPDAEQLLDGLSIALKHPYLSADPRVLCAVACVCRDWREAARQCDARNTHVQLFVRQVALPNHTWHGMSVALPPGDDQLISFASWLMRHAALVKSMAISTKQTPAAVQFSADSARVMQRVQAAMLTTAAVAATAAAGALGADGAQQQPAAAQQQAGLQLASLELDPCTSMSAVNLLATMAALPHTQHSLTQLSLSDGRLCQDNAAVLSAALPRLTRLEQLKASSLPYTCLAALVQLSSLTRLDLHGFPLPGAATELHYGNQHHAEAALQRLLGLPLPLRQLHLHDVWDLPVLDMSKMTNLTEFVVTPREYLRVPVGSVLPTGLRCLDLTSDDGEQLAAVTGSSRSGLAPLHQLTALSIEVGFQEAAPLLLLTKLSVLQQFRLWYEGQDAVQRAASTAAAWGQLPLTELWVKPDDDDLVSKQLLATLARGLAAATSLTKLRLLLQEAGRRNDDLSDGAAGADTSEPFAKCASVAHLTNLRHLELATQCLDELQPADVLAMTALTGLTHLALRSSNGCVGGVEATALACNLTQLCHLELMCDSGWMAANPLGYMESFLAVGQLKQLTALRLQANAKTMADFSEHLMLLTGLSCLQTLDVEVYDDSINLYQGDPPQDLLDKFWAALRQGSAHRRGAC
jgi:hypothetical protein